MTSKTRSSRLSPAMIVACLALLLALSGSAIAAGVAKNSVRSAQIVDGTVRTLDLRDSAVNSAKVADDSLIATDIAADAIGNSEIADNAIASPEVAPDSLTANDLGPDSVGASELQSGSIRAAELAPIVQASNTTAIAANGNANVTATCPAGTTVISGGGSAGLYAIHMTSTYRSGNGWHIDSHNNSASASSITAFAYCLAG